MRFDDLHLTGIGCHLGSLTPVSGPVTAGTYTPEEAAKTGQLSTSVADRHGPDLAVSAAREALRHADAVSGETVRPSLSLHAGIYYAGIDFWHAASYVRDQLGIGPWAGLALEIGAMSNSMVAGLDLAASVLSGRPDHEDVLLTAGDRFGDPGFPHWSTDIGIVYGDAGSAIVVSRRPGFARLLSVASFSDPSLEGLQRGAEPFRSVSSAARTPIDIRLRKRQWLEDRGTDYVHTRNSDAVTTVVKTALTDAGLDLPDLAKICAPHYGRHLVRSQILRPLGIAEEQTMTGLGLRLGHLGASDQIVALHHLMRTGEARRGDHVLLLGVGVGMTWTAAVLRIEREIPPPGGIGR
ncbi:3-oxoacyl-[acyl-carrier-protein] synthase III C-terminal domain-containing protein [Amycolatopsis sp. CA-230715]|uniref:3-oxoacyl-[acyl-carrier-protein] synthase III C-terminal domain-containing protein n=1 Tax=Amycolatopsis sp. CA-230715 TaxID=2745196 RepID=UPI001C034BB3|nr:3-oxoacyl-[acyl-carrier-protein] synthase III C-terminal domain-containing protein [Amycolatopsis sp. CA-230715]QWF76686.1 3-oxoacyl-[acyl-carrier-protein] synthase 3 [Amycolatopsis sp. CA-230715]